MEKKNVLSKIIWLVIEAALLILALAGVAFAFRLLLKAVLG